MLELEPLTREVAATGGEPMNLANRPRHDSSPKPPFGLGSDRVGVGDGPDGRESPPESFRRG